MSSETQRTVEFSFDAPAAATVFLAGTFNGWEPAALPLTRDDGGSWRATVELPPGRHEFKFIVDGTWCCDPGQGDSYRECEHCVPNQFGTMNRFIDVQ